MCTSQKKTLVLPLLVSRSAVEPLGEKEEMRSAMEKTKYSVLIDGADPTEDAARGSPHLRKIKTTGLSKTL